MGTLDSDQFRASCGRCVRSRSRRRVALHNHAARPAARRWNPGLRHRLLTRRRPLVPAHGRSSVLHRLFRTSKRRAHGADSYGRAEGWSDGLSTSDRARYVPGLGLRLTFSQISASRLPAYKPSASHEGSFGRPGSDPLPNPALYESRRRRRQAGDRDQDQGVSIGAAAARGSRGVASRLL
jgi:hypothetical protein